ncbi:MAG TPA: HEAT repeat domain-containing protein [Phycisphaerae bacterium]|nr:HEAT repeat domain-containing protein [Phycisphaerae bacterium]
MKLCRLINFLLVIQLCLFTLLVAGCSLFDLGGPNLNSDDPSQKIPAMRQAAQNHDISAIPALIDALGSEDPAIRFYAIYALEQITGQQFGYVYYAPEPQRDTAIERWKEWLAKNNPNNSAKVGGA